MRVHSLAVPLLVLSLVAGAALAQESLRVSPGTLRPGDESFITIFVQGLSSVDLVTLTFSGPAGQFTLEPSYVDASQIITYVPDMVMRVEGRYSVGVTVQRGELIQNLGVGFFD